MGMGLPPVPCITHNNINITACRVPSQNLPGFIGGGDQAVRVARSPDSLTGTSFPVTRSTASMASMVPKTRSSFQA